MYAMIELATALCKKNDKEFIYQDFPIHYFEFKGVTTLIQATFKKVYLNV